MLSFFISCSVIYLVLYILLIVLTCVALNYLTNLVHIYAHLANFACAYLSPLALNYLVLPRLHVLSYLSPVTRIQTHFLFLPWLTYFTSYSLMSSFGSYLHYLPDNNWLTWHSLNYFSYLALTYLNYALTWHWIILHTWQFHSLPGTGRALCLRILISWHSLSLTRH